MSRKMWILGFGFAADPMTFAKSFPPSPAFPAVKQDKECVHSDPRASLAGRGGDEQPERLGKLNTLRPGEAGPPHRPHQSAGPGSAFPGPASLPSPGGARAQGRSIPGPVSMVSPLADREGGRAWPTPSPLVAPSSPQSRCPEPPVPAGRPGGQASARGARRGRGEFRFRFFVQLQQRLRGRWRPGRVSSLWLRAAAPEPQEGRARRLPWARAGLRGLPCEWARRRVRGCTALRCPGRPIR